MWKPVSGKKNRQEIEGIPKFIYKNRNEKETKKNIYTTRDSKRHGCPQPLPPSCQRCGKIWGGLRLASDHSGLGSMPKLKSSVIVTPACAADMEAEVLVACGTPERGFPLLVGLASSDTCCTLHNKPHRGCCRWPPGNIQCGVVPHFANEGGLTAGPVDCCAVVANELQAEFIYEHVEGAKAVAGMRVGSVGIHNDVGVVHGPNKELHDKPVRQVVAA